jgi:uncharacterized protein YecT (DUF1311 family)
MEVCAMRWASVAILVAIDLAARSVRAEDPVAVPSTVRCAANYTNEFAYRACYQAVLDDSSVVLAQVVKAVDTRLQQRIADENSAMVNELKAEGVSFRAGQVAWQKYRDAQCDMVAHDYLGGTGRASGYLKCLADITRSRILELWGFTGWPPPRLSGA